MITTQTEGRITHEAVGICPRLQELKGLQKPICISVDFANFINFQILREFTWLMYQIIGSMNLHLVLGQILVY